MSTTATQTIGDSSVLLGFWTNWSHGSIRGATLTLTKSSGALLTAAVALFVTYVGVRFWRIVCFILHQWLSSSEPEDAIYHQRQALLRGSGSSSGILVDLFWMMWSWRKRTKTSHVLRELMPLFVLASTLTGAFVVSGVFSSRISSTMGDYVLLSGYNCGYLWWGMDIETTDVNALMSYSNRLAFESAAYVQNCYRSEVASPDCPTYVQKSIESTIIRNASCPFDDKICLLRDSNLIIDTGHIDSNEAMGLNSRPENRYTYRRVTSCAPLRTEGYSERVNETIQSIEFPFMRYYYGPNIHTGDNITHDYPAFRPSNLSKNAADYTLMALKSYAFYWGDFDPIPELNQTGTRADIALLMLSTNDVSFEQPVTDPWYSATTEVHSKFTYDLPLYISDQPISFVACKVQHQWCVPDKQEAVKCTPLASATEAEMEAQNLAMNPSQNASFRATNAAIGVAPGIEAIVERLGVSALTSRYTLSVGIQGPLPADQWQNEIINLHSISLAMFQRMTIEQALGPSDENVERFFIRPRNGLEREARCQQKIRSTKYTSFSVLGLGIALGIGVIIIFLSYILESLTACIQRHRKSNPHHRLEWILNSPLQLQRLAHEESGFGTWSMGVNIVPLTDQNEKLATLDLEDMGHPRLQTRRSEVTSSGEVEQGLANDGTLTSEQSSDRDVKLVDTMDAVLASPISPSNSSR